MTTFLVTGGSGYFGTVLVDRLLAAGHRVRVFDLNPPAGTGPEFARGDVRDRDAVRAACDSVDVVLHNVAQVPLAKDRALFQSVNVLGTANVLLAARVAGVAKVVSTSSSAIFGIPPSNPVTEETPPRPLEAYGRAKLEAEHLCRDAVGGGLDVTIVRPRTILGHGRLGIMAVLFELVAAGAPVFVLGNGSNRYQLVHADDLADACIAAAGVSGPGVFNIGTDRFGTMFETLDALCRHAGTGAVVRSLPVRPAAAAMRVSARLGATPFAPYHWLMYSESMWFDIEHARQQLGWEPKWSTDDMFSQSYDWFLVHRAEASAGASQHRRSAKQGALAALKHVTGVLPRARGVA